MARKMTGSQIIVGLLRQNGIGTVAGIPGGSILPLYDELYGSGIRHVLVRQEQAAGFIAQGMARVTGRAAVCIATSGPGAMNLLTAVADARCDSVPMVALTGQVNTDLIGTDAFQEADTFGLSFPITKHSIMVKSPEELLEAVPMAFAVAETGRPGPVLLDVPRNVQSASCDVPDDFDTLFARAYARAVERLSRGSLVSSGGSGAVGRFRDVLCGSERPVLYVGGGANSPRASEEVRRLLSLIPMPSVGSLMGIGAVDTTSRGWLGMVGMHGSVAANRAMHDADVVLAVGVRFDDRATGVASEFCPGAAILHIDIDAAEVDKILPSDSFLVRDAAEALSELNCRLSSDGVPESSARSEWLSRCASLRAEESNSRGGGCAGAECCGRRSCGAKDGAEFVNPREFIAGIPEAAKSAGAGSEPLVVTTDVGQHQMWTAQFFPFVRPRQLLTSGSLGTMGFGLPAAIGAALALPGRRVVCFSGDGSIMMNVQELATLSELGLDVTVVVLENGALGMVRQQQEYLFGRRYSASTFERSPDLLAIAAGFGIRAVDADDAGWERAAFGEAGPCFVRVRVARSENVLPFVKAGCANIDSIR